MTTMYSAYNITADSHPVRLFDLGELLFYVSDKDNCFCMCDDEIQISEGHLNDKGDFIIDKILLTFMTP